MERLDYAILFATKAHDGQRRKTDNVDMIFHPFTVGMILQRAGMNEDTVIAGILHDVVEDTKYTINDIEKIFVELLGTPKSGKTTLLKNLRGLFNNNELEIFTRRETAEYNPVEKESKQYDLWMVLELFRNLSEDISNKQGRIVVYDRGIIDRLTWLENAVESGEISREDLSRISGLYNLESIRKEYKPITLGFLTSPELTVKRKGSEGRYVNLRTLGAYNKILLRSQDRISGLSSSYSLTSTDNYEGRLEDFILDMSSDLTGKIAKQLEVKKEEQVKSCISHENNGEER